MVPPFQPLQPQNGEDGLKDLIGKITSLANNSNQQVSAFDSQQIQGLINQLSYSNQDPNIQGQLRSIQSVLD